MSQGFEFLVAGLPERVHYLEEKGCFEEAVRLINKILTENRMLPRALESRLEWEPPEN